MNALENAALDFETLPSTTQPPVYSIVAPVFNEAETLPHFYERVVAFPLVQNLQTSRMVNDQTSEEGDSMHE